MRDFTITKYKFLLDSLIKHGYNSQTFEGFLKEPVNKGIILRHDVDLLPNNSLVFAKIQASMNIKGVYYFRAVAQSWDEIVIREIASMGHEIGYHYECLTTCKGDVEKGIIDFENNLIALRKLAPVSTICMHGSPMSKYDSKDLWKHYDYRSFGIIGEPYFDIDFAKVYYLTDTGRRWNGNQVSVRDKVVSGFGFKIHSTSDIIQHVERNLLPNHIMFTFHPQRWNDSNLNWFKEYVFQNVKNQVKRFIFVK